MLECFSLYFGHFINEIGRFCAFCLTVDACEHKQTKESIEVMLEQIIHSFVCFFLKKKGCPCPFTNAMCRVWTTLSSSTVCLFFLQLPIFLHYWFSLIKEETKGQGGLKEEQGRKRRNIWEISPQWSLAAANLPSLSAMISRNVVPSSPWLFQGLHLAFLPPCYSQRLFILLSSLAYSLLHFMY